ncbi:MAG: prenyltransferase/squalene oxidase repeat-containing protein [Cellulosilyticaceae bacterium]
MRYDRKICSLILAGLISSQLVIPVFAASSPVNLVCFGAATVQPASAQKNKGVPQKVTKALDQTTEYMLKNVSKPQFGSVGGEWAVFGLARRGVQVPKEYYENYYKHIEEVVKTEHSKQSRKWKSKVTETQRLAIAVAAIRKDPTNVKGVNLIDYSFNKGKNMPDLSKADQPLGNRQGLNELVFGLIAMDLKKTPQPKNVEITRNQIISKIIKHYTTPDGGFSLSTEGKLGEIDITAMTIQSLAPYYKQKGFEHVTKAVDDALKFLSLNQKKNGGFVDSLSFSDQSILGNCESAVQVVTALCSLGIDPTTDKRFIKNGRNLIDEILSYQLPNGGFEHVKGQGVNQMATEQGYYGLVAYERLIQGKSRIYDMTEME